jgi:hypothetical protein
MRPLPMQWRSLDNEGEIGGCCAWDVLPGPIADPGIASQIGQEMKA